MQALALAALLCVPTSAGERPPLGASWYGARGGFQDPSALDRIAAAGFKLVSIVPTYPYVDEDRVDLSGGPAWDELESAVGAALARGMAVTLKPHLDPPKYITGYAPPKGARLRGGAGENWRGSFALDPMCADYRRLIGGLLELLARLPSGGPPVRLELGSELLTSESRRPERWLELLRWAKRRRRALGLGGRVLLSHNFAHHFELAADEVDKMTPAGRKALASYIKGLDALALSQYRDLTVAVPPGAKRRPTPDEIAAALVAHDQAFVRDILEGRLGLAPEEIPPLHIGEFGVGTGGLAKPNQWGPLGTPEAERRLGEEIALGMKGLTRYLSLAKGRRARSAALWLVGPHYDVFGWDKPDYAVPAAAEAVERYLKPER